jgi:hypothetical protein
VCVCESPPGARSGCSPRVPILRPDNKRQKATRALHRMAFARLSPRPSRDSVSGRIVCGRGCLSRVRWNYPQFQTNERASATRPLKASDGSLPPRLLRLLPAGATLAGRDLHPLKNCAFPRHTTSSPLLPDLRFGTHRRGGAHAMTGRRPSFPAPPRRAACRWRSL